MRQERPLKEPEFGSHKLIVATERSSEGNSTSLYNQFQVETIPNLRSNTVFGGLKSDEGNTISASSVSEPQSVSDRKESKSETP